MTGWDGWSPQRFFYLFIGAAYLLVWIQVLLFHWRGAFRHWPMWGPALFSPVLAVMGILYAFVHGGWINAAFVAVFAVGAIEGLMGVFYHFKGVQHYIGGVTLRNLMAGPPVIMPMMFTALSLAALLVYFIWPYQGGSAYAALP